MAQLSAARRLARFAVGLELNEIPTPVVANATLLTLDTLGNALAASQEDFGRAVLAAAARLGGPAESALIGRSGRVAAANAVLANATLAHGLDFDDTRQDAIVHTGCVAVTTALAVGEAVAATGGQLLEALIAGVEVMCRVGLAVPGALHARHFHPTAIAGSFGAAAAAARLQKLSEEQLVRAFGICGSQAGGIIEYLADGSWTKRLHPGWAAVASRRLVLGHQVVAFLALAPVVIPGVVLAVGLFVAYTRPPLILYGTLWILFVAYLTKEMPVGYAQSEATFRGIPADLEDAGRILGAGRLRVLLDVTTPLAKSGVIAAWCFIFIGVIRELSASILLFTPDTKVISVVMFDLKEEGQFGAIAVLGLTMLALTFATVALVQAVLGRDVLGARD